MLYLLLGLIDFPPYFFSKLHKNKCVTALYITTKNVAPHVYKSYTMAKHALTLGMQVSDITSRLEFIIETRDKIITFSSYFPVISLYVQLSQDVRTVIES